MSTNRDRNATSLGAIPLGRIFGIPLSADFSVLIIFALVASQLGLFALPSWHPEWSAALTWGIALGAAVLFFVSILLHELAHSVVAKANGMGVHGITLFVFGGVSQIEGESPSPKAEFTIAIVGPLASLVIGIAGIVGAGALGAGVLTEATEETAAQVVAQLTPGATLLLWLGFMNIILAVFNMIPGFPLDGGRVLRALLWWYTDDLDKATRWASRAGQGVGVALVAWGILLIFASPIAGLWRILIGWFLYNAAKASYQQMRVHRLLSNVPVRRVMRSDPATIPPTLRVDELVHDYLMRTDQRCFPVMDGERLLGIVCLDDVRRVKEEEWTTTQVREILTSANELATVDIDAAADEALRELGTKEIDQLPVMEEGRLVGILRRQDLLKWLSLHLEDAPTRA